jgi:hypothetical protein
MKAAADIAEAADVATLDVVDGAVTLETATTAAAPATTAPRPTATGGLAVDAGVAISNPTITLTLEYTFALKFGSAIVISTII